MRALVGFLMIGVTMAIVACNKDGGGGSAPVTTPGVGAYGAYAGTPQPCNTSKYMMGMCSPQQIPISMPGAWTLGTPWSFPQPWDAAVPTCGCPRTTVAYPGQPAFVQEQFGVYFAINNSVACAPIGYFNGSQMWVGNPNALIQQVSQMGIYAGSYAGMNPYGGSPAYGYGSYFGSNYGPTNYMPISNPQAYGSYGSYGYSGAYGGYGGMSGISDPSALRCMSRMVIGCDLAMEQRLRAQGQSQCNGGTCVPAVQNQPSATLGYCSYGSPYFY